MSLFERNENSLKLPWGVNGEKKKIIMVFSKHTFTKEYIYNTWFTMGNDENSNLLKHWVICYLMKELKLVGFRANAIVYIVGKMKIKFQNTIKHITNM